MWVRRQTWINFQRILSFNCTFQETQMILRHLVPAFSITQFTIVARKDLWFLKGIRKLNWGSHRDKLPLDQENLHTTLISELTSFIAIQRKSAIDSALAPVVGSFQSYKSSIEWHIDEPDQHLNDYDCIVALYCLRGANQIAAPLRW